MGKLRPAPAGYSVVKLPELGGWVMLVHQCTPDGTLADLLPLQDTPGRVKVYAKRSGAIGDAILHQQKTRIAELEARIAQLEGTTVERLQGVS